jgi:hypothetical protein
MEKNFISPSQKNLTKEAAALTKEMEEEKNLGFFFFKKKFLERGWRLSLFSNNRDSIVFSLHFHASFFFFFFFDMSTQG